MFKHKELRKPFHCFPVEGQDYIFKCLVYTPANIRSSIFPPAFDSRFKEHSVTQGNTDSETRSKPQKVERFGLDINMT